MSIAGSSRPCSGSEHLFSHALDMVKSNHAMHGEQCGVGAIMMTCLHKENWKQVRKTLKMVGGPTNANGLHVENEYVIKALEIAPTIRPERYTILNKLSLKREDYERLAKKTYIIK